jgi:hypothetical protein
VRRKGQCEGAEEADESSSDWSSSRCMLSRNAGRTSELRPIKHSAEAGESDSE